MKRKDLMDWVIRRAVRRFGGTDGTFNAAGFSVAWKEVTGLKGGLDGEAVRAILHGRPGVHMLPGGSHFRMRGV